MTSAATLGMVDLRHDPAVRAGTLAWQGPDVVTGWHHHPYHQLEYALTGVAEVGTACGRYLLPRQQAIWIPAGVEHNTTLRAVRSVAVFFHPDYLAPAATQAKVLAVPPVLREMVHYATRWPIDRSAEADELADAIFGTLAALVAESLDGEPLPFWLPLANDPAVAAAIELTVADLATARLSDICATVGISERTLRRRIKADTGWSWSEYLTQARLMRAMTLLASSDRSVLDVATAVGFASPSGFTRAFRQLTGTTPAAYRSHALAEGYAPTPRSRSQPTRG